MLQFQTASINLTKGLETKDDELLADGNDVMENVDMSLNGTPRKRHGFKKYEASRYSTDLTSKTFQETLNNLNEAVPLKNKALISNNESCYIFSQRLNGYTSDTIPSNGNKQGDTSYPLLEATRIGSESASGSQLASGSAFFAENSLFYAYGIGEKLHIKDKSSEAEVINERSSSNLNSPRLTVLNDVIYIAYYEDTGVADAYKLGKINQDGFFEEVATIESPAYVISLAQSMYHDMVSDGVNLYTVNWGDPAGSDIFTARKLDTDGTILNSYTYDGSTGRTYLNMPIQISVSSSHVAISCVPETAGGGSAVLENFKLDTSMTYQSLVQSLSSFGSNFINANVFAGLNGDKLYVGITARESVINTETSTDTFSDIYNEFSRAYTFDLDVDDQDTPNSITEFNGAAFTSKPVAQENSVIFLCKYREDEADNDYFYTYGAVKFTPVVGCRVCAIFKKGQALGTATSTLDRYLIPSDLSLTGSFLARFGQTRLERYSLSLTRFNTGPYIELQETTLIPGALPSVFDGDKILPAGVYSRPKLTSSSTASGSVPAGTYDYIAVFRQSDARGNIYRGRESNDFQVTIGSSQDVTLTFGSYGPLDAYLRDDMGIELYRKESTETVYRLVASGIAISNGTVTDSLASTDGQPALYTTGDVLESSCPPSLIDLASHQNRVLGISLDEKVLFTKTLVRGEALEFSDFLAINVDENQGRRSQSLKAISGMDNKIILFKQNSIFAIFGNGPDSTGANNDFTFPELITTDVGCDSPRSIVLNSGGIYFKGEKGVYQLTRASQISFVGADVDRFRGETITSAVLLEESNRVVFTTESGVGLVHNYNRETWTTYTNFDAISAFMSNGKFLIFKSDATAWEEKDERDDDGAFIQQKITSNWLKVAGVQGFQRIQRVFLLGKYRGDHTMKVRVYYDYQDYFWDEYTLTPIDADYNTETKPSLPDYYSGANDGTFQWNIHLRKQKCQAIKIEIFDEERGGSPTEGFSLSNMTAKIGVKVGPFKGSDTKAV